MWQGVSVPISPASPRRIGAADSKTRERLLDAAEQLMLEGVCDPQPNSRLACQIKVSDELEGLTVHIPARQV